MNILEPSHKNMAVFPRGKYLDLQLLSAGVHPMSLLFVFLLLYNREPGIVLVMKLQRLHCSLHLEFQGSNILQSHT